MVAAAALQLAMSGFSPALRLRPSPACPRRLYFPPRCCLPADGGEESTESLFMKELRRRGMIPTSLVEDGDRGQLEWVQREMEAEEGDGGRGERTNRNGVASAEFEKGMLRQRELSMALNSEGLEGLIPRARLLLTVGGTFFWGFWPLILVTIGLFTALYLYLGPSFVHDASKMPVSPPPYMDPYSLLEDERLPHMASNGN